MKELTLICKFWTYIVSSRIQNHFFPMEFFCFFHWGVVKESRMFYWFLLQQFWDKLKVLELWGKKKKKKNVQKELTSNMIGAWRNFISTSPASYPFVVIQSLSRVWLLATPWTTACQDSLSFAVSQSLLKLRSIVSVMY